jgi:hypothetical protein
MNAINYGLSYIKRYISEELLTITFKENSRRVNQIIGLDERIRTKVIQPVIMVDANLVGGITTKIPVNDCNVKTMDTNELIIEVPKTLTGGKSILSALSLVSNHLTPNSYVPGAQSPIESAAVNMMNNIGSADIIQTSRLELIGDNIVIVQAQNLYLTNTVLMVKVENDNKLNNLNPRSYPDFGELCILGTKAYIYNYMRHKIGKGYIYGGHELSTIKEELDSFADADAMYKDFLKTKWRKIAFLNDNIAKDNFIQSMIANTL